MAIDRLDPGRKVYLCAGLQSGGSTLVSWCFLQRADMDGVLDARFDTLPVVPRVAPACRVWIKITLACFGFADVRTCLEDEGWSVQPLLVVRDVRNVFNSLVRKEYGRNGITADDPPLRLRLRRFLTAWRMFRDRGLPMLRFEDLAVDPERALRQACEGLNLPWDRAMLDWPKPIERIADSGGGNETFLLSRAGSLAATFRPELAKVDTTHVPPEDLEWMEREFAEFNAAMRYPAHADSAASSLPARAVPSFANTRRHESLRRRESMLQQAFGAAVRHWQGGRSGDAEAVCRNLLSSEPNHSDATGLLGLLMCRSGRLEEGVAMLRRAVELDRDNAAFHCNLGIAQTSLGQTGPAIASFRTALALQPDLLAAQAGLGALLHPNRPRAEDPSISSAQFRAAGSEFAGTNSVRLPESFGSSGRE